MSGCWLGRAERMRRGWDVDVEGKAGEEDKVVIQEGSCYCCRSFMGFIDDAALYTQARLHAKQFNSASSGSPPKRVKHSTQNSA
jgi:hypothetical protein